MKCQYSVQHVMQIYTDLLPANLQMADDVFFTFSMLAAAL